MPFLWFGTGAPAPWASSNTTPHDSTGRPRCFLYGPLMDPGVLQSICRTRRKPELVKAYVTGYKMKMCGLYPTLIPGKASEKVDGVLWKADEAGQLQYLQAFETEKGKMVECKMSVGEEEDDRRIEIGYAFIWAGDSRDQELTDGKFSLEDYQYFNKTEFFGEG